MNPQEIHKDKIKGKYVIVEDDVEIGEGTEIWNYVHIRRGAKIGKNCKIGDYTYIDQNVEIGNNCKIQNRCDIYQGVTLEDSVFLGPNVTTTNVRKPHSDHVVPSSAYVKTIIRRGAAIGANCTIVCGAEVGEDCLIAAGNIVMGNQRIPKETLAHGFPINQYPKEKMVKGWMYKHYTVKLN